MPVPLLAIWIGGLLAMLLGFTVLLGLLALAPRVDLRKETFADRLADAAFALTLVGGGMAFLAFIIQQVVR